MSLPEPDGSSDESVEASLDAIPLFPLPNVVLFPRAILPLHIFEERYRQMTKDVLSGDGRLAMALLKPGWEKDYYSKPVIEPVVCVGKVVSWEKLPDGKYNFLLQGQQRARVVKEIRDDSGIRLYRIAKLEPVREMKVLEIDLEGERRKLARVFNTGGLAALPLAKHFREMAQTGMSTAEIADIAAFTFLEDVALKQELLEETDVAKRVRTVIGALEAMNVQFNPAMRGLPAEPGEN